MLGLFFYAMNTSAEGRVNAFGYREIMPLLSLSFLVMGALVVSRVSGNPVGWFLLVVGCLNAIDFFAENYATYGVLTEPNGVPLADYAAWVHYWIWMPMVAVVVLYLTAFFPDGKPLSPGWLRVTLAGTAVSLLATVGFAFESGQLDEYPLVENPVGLSGSLGDVADVLTALQYVAVAFAVPVAWSQIQRFRAATDVERHQIMWFAGAAALLAVAFIINLAAWLGGGYTSAFLQSLILAGMATIPIAMGVAVLRYRLYDIDLILNRTLVYVPLTAILAGIYIAVTGVLRSVVTDSTGGNSDVSIAFTTIVVVALLTPVKNYLQEHVDKLFKEPAHATKELHDLQTRIRNVAEVLDVQQVANSVLRAAATSVGATGGRLRFMHGDHLHVVEQGQAEPATTSLPITYGEQELGRLSLAIRDDLRTPELEALQELGNSFGYLLWLTEQRKPEGLSPLRTPTVAGDVRHR